MFYVSEKLAMSVDNGNDAKLYDEILYLGWFAVNQDRAYLAGGKVVIWTPTLDDIHLFKRHKHYLQFDVNYCLNGAMSKEEFCRLRAVYAFGQICPEIFLSRRAELPISENVVEAERLVYKLQQYIRKNSDFKRLVREAMAARSEQAKLLPYSATYGPGGVTIRNTSLSFTK